VNVLCCRVEVFATGRSLVQRSPTDCGVSLCLTYKPKNETVRAPVGPLRQKENYAIVSPTYTTAVVREIYFKGIYVISECTFLLEGATRVSFRVLHVVVLDTDWPVQH
jgi:hypothetical protein